MKQKSASLKNFSKLWFIFCLGQPKSISRQLHSKLKKIQGLFKQGLPLKFKGFSRLCKPCLRQFLCVKETGHVSQNKYSKLLLITPPPSYNPYTCKQQHHPIISPQPLLGVCCLRKQSLFFLDSPLNSCSLVDFSVSNSIKNGVVLIYKRKEN